MRGVDGSSDALVRLRGIASTINAGGGLQTLLDRVLLAVCDGRPWSRGGIMAVNRASFHSELVASFEPPEDAGRRGQTRWPLATSPVLAVVDRGQPLVIPDAQQAAEYAAYQADALARDYRTVVLLPLGCTTADEHEMVLSIHTRNRVEVTESELDLLATIAHLVAIAVEKVKHLTFEQRQSERLRRILEAGSHLMELVLDGAPASVTAGVIAGILPDPFVILDGVSDTVIVRRSPAPDTLDEREWRAMAEGPALHLLSALAERAGALGIPGETRLDLASAGLALALPVWAEPLRVAGETVGGLLVFPRGHAPDSLDRVVTQELRFALSAQVMRQHAESRHEAEDRSHLFGLLCEAGPAEPHLAAARAARLGLDAARPVLLLAVAPPPLPGPVPLSSLRRLLAGELGRAVPGALAVEHGGAVVLLWPLAGSAITVPPGVLDRHVLNPVRARWGMQPTVAAGPLCTAPSAYGSAAAECARTLRLAQAFGRQGVVRQGDFGPFALLMSALDGPAMRDFVEDTLGPVRRHDAEHGGALLETASCFIDESCRYQATAERLAIHVTTLRYRLRRLNELFGLDLDEAETRFRVALAARLHALSGIEGAPASLTTGV